VEIVERNMSGVDMRGSAILPGSGARPPLTVLPRKRKRGAPRIGAGVRSTARRKNAGNLLGYMVR
jgi:hypothetical protein